MPTAIALLEKTNDELLEALESMARQHCHTNPETHETDSGAISANGEALEMLHEFGRFKMTRGFGRMIVGYWPEEEEFFKPNASSSPEPAQPVSGATLG